MRLKRLTATAASLILLGSGGYLAAAASPAHAATPSCGITCIDVFSEQFGEAEAGHPGFLVDSYKQGIATGTPVILFRESNSDPAEDFAIENQGAVSDFYAAGLVGAATAMHYGCVATVNFPVCLYGTDESDGSADLAAFEVEYDPFGAATGQCAGLAATPTAGEKITLQPCGVSARTVWIIDVFDNANAANPFGPGAPVINGANTNFSHPFVATYPSSGYPTDSPRPVLYVSNLTGHPGDPEIFPTFTLADEDVNSSQIWSAFIGPVQG